MFGFLFKFGKKILPRFEALFSGETKNTFRLGVVFFWASKDCTCFKKCLWNKFASMNLATMQSSVCWKGAISGNVHFICLRVCQTKSLFRTLSASILPSVLWKGHSNGKVLCTCSITCKNSTLILTSSATTAARAMFNNEFLHDYFWCFWYI